MGGELIGGLGGDSAFSTIGGAVGAGMSSKFAPQTKELSDAVAGAADSSLIGNLAGNIASGLAGAAVGGMVGAAGASNVNLYNQGEQQERDRGSEGRAGAEAGARQGARDAGPG